MDDDILDAHLHASPDCNWANMLHLVEQCKRDPVLFTDKATRTKYTALLKNSYLSYPKTWPHDKRRGWKGCSIASMCKAGFAFTPDDSSDLVTCWLCDLALDEWEKGDVALEEHQKRAPECMMFKTIATTKRRKKQIDEVILDVEDEQVNNDQSMVAIVTTVDTSLETVATDIDSEEPPVKKIGRGRPKKAASETVLSPDPAELVISRPRRAKAITEKKEPSVKRQPRGRKAKVVPIVEEQRDEEEQETNKTTSPTADKSMLYQLSSATLAEESTVDGPSQSSDTAMAQPKKRQPRGRKAKNVAIIEEEPVEDEKKLDDASNEVLVEANTKSLVNPAATEVIDEEPVMPTLPETAPAQQLKKQEAEEADLVPEEVLIFPGDDAKQIESIETEHKKDTTAHASTKEVKTTFKESMFAKKFVDVIEFDKENVTVEGALRYLHNLELQRIKDHTSSLIEELKQELLEAQKTLTDRIRIVE